MICKHQKYCGGCVGLDREYSSLLQEKTEYIRGLFKEFDNIDISQCQGNYYPLKYRNKIHLAFTELKGKTLIGFFEEGSSKVVDINNCSLFADWADKLISILREYLSRFKIRAYKDGAGILRYAHARCIEGRLQLTLVVTTDNFAGRSWLLHKLTQEFSQVSFYLNINRRTDHAVFDRIFKFVGGEKYLNFELNGIKVSLTPSSFLQVNLSIASKMYKSAMKMLDIKSDTTVIDLYSGIGITSMMFAGVAKHVISIEEVESAVSSAKIIAKNNGVKNISIMAGKCEKVIDQIKKIEGDVVIFVDPARAGLDINVIKSLIRLNPRRIVYMSCNPETCVRDVRQLKDDYEVLLIAPWDMFPYTRHVELLVALENKRK